MMKPTIKPTGGLGYPAASQHPIGSLADEPVLQRGIDAHRSKAYRQPSEEWRQVNERRVRKTMSWKDNDGDRADRGEASRAQQRETKKPEGFVVVIWKNDGEVQPQADRDRCGVQDAREQTKDAEIGG
jgi:hypothetical protein